MSSVNPLFPSSERHAALLMGLLMREVSQTFAAEDWGGLRQSHFRVLASTPTQGVSITELAERVGMTKQGCGQFVTHLSGTGHLRVEPDPDDARVRVVRRTPAGQRTVISVTRRVRRIEADWAERVGAERYAVFRSVVEELAQGAVVAD